MHMLHARPAPVAPAPASDDLLGHYASIADNLNADRATPEEVACLCHAMPALIAELRGWRRWRGSVRGLAATLATRAANGNARALPEGA